MAKALGPHANLRAFSPNTLSSVAHGVRVTILRFGNSPMPHPGYITFHGEPYALSGSPLPVGSPAPDFMLVQFEAGVQRVIDRQTLLDAGKPVLLSVITSVDTPVGSLQARTFETMLREFSGRVTALLVSSDLPFTLNRFRETENLRCLEGSSDYYGSFGEAYGVLIADPRVLARAVFVLDSSCIVRYAEVVDEITHEPNHRAAIEALIPLLEPSRAPSGGTSYAAND
jgi:thioredoxin-dependent peroxiredoxin